MCDFKGCDRPDLQPVQTNGWFWTAELQKIAPTTDRSQGDWSENGGIGLPQPDDREYKQGGAHEHCLAVLNQFYNDGVNWHDVACHHKKVRKLYEQIFHLNLLFAHSDFIQLFSIFFSRLFSRSFAKRMMLS